VTGHTILLNSVCSSPTTALADARALAKDPSQLFHTSRFIYRPAHARGSDGVSTVVTLWLAFRYRPCSGAGFCNRTSQPLSPATRARIFLTRRPQVPLRSPRSKLCRCSAAGVSTLKNVLVVSTRPL